MRSPFPLQWPPGWDRTPPQERSVSRFITGMARATRGLRLELERLGAANVVISSDLPTRSNGTPYGSAADNGVAVWFVLDGEEHVLACDRWLQAAENIHAITLTIAAIRGIGRWGVRQASSRAFQGFKALPPAPEPAREPWWIVLCIQRDVLEPKLATWAKAKRAHRMLMRVADTGTGDTEQAIRLNAALADARLELDPPEDANGAADSGNDAVTRTWPDE